MGRLRLEVLRGSARSGAGSRGRAGTGAAAHRVVVLVSLEGDFDVSDADGVAEDLDRALLAAEDCPWEQVVGDGHVAVPAGSQPEQRTSAAVVLDCSGVTFMDCACLAVLIDYARRTRALGVRMVLHDPSVWLQWLLGLLGLDPEDLAAGVDAGSPATSPFTPDVDAAADGDADGRAPR